MIEVKPTRFHMWWRIQPLVYRYYLPQHPRPIGVNMYASRAILAKTPAACSLHLDEALSTRASPSCSLPDDERLIEFIRVSFVRYAKR